MPRPSLLPGHGAADRLPAQAGGGAGTRRLRRAGGQLRLRFVGACCGEGQHTFSGGCAGNLHAHCNLLAATLAMCQPANPAAEHGGRGPDYVGTLTNLFKVSCWLARAPHAGWMAGMPALENSDHCLEGAGIHARVRCLTTPAPEPARPWQPQPGLQDVAAAVDEHLELMRDTFGAGALPLLATGFAATHTISGPVCPSCAPCAKLPLPACTSRSSLCAADLGMTALQSIHTECDVHGTKLLQARHVLHTCLECVQARMRTCCARWCGTPGDLHQHSGVLLQHSPVGRAAAALSSWSCCVQHTVFYRPNAETEHQAGTCCLAALRRLPAASPHCRPDRHAQAGRHHSGSCACGAAAGGMSAGLQLLGSNCN